MGGSQYQAKCIIEELQLTDMFNIFFITRESDPNYTSNGYKLIQYGYPGVNRHGIHRDLYELLFLPKILKRIQPDIIYQRVGCSQTGIAARYASKYCCRMFWHIAHENDLESSSSVLSRSIIYRSLERYLLNYGIRHAEHVIAQTKDQKRLLEKNFRRSPSAVIPNFHPIPAENISKKTSIKVVWVANLKEIKQPEFFIKLSKALGHLADVQFLMVGAIQGDIRKKQKYFELMNQSSNLRYLGPKRQEEVNEILSKSHIFVNTSVREGFPNTFIQAWLRKVPVVSLTVNPDRLIDRHGLGLVSGSFAQLKKDVSLLIEDHDLRERLGANAQCFAGEYFSMRNAEKLVRLFNGLL
ncbi:glycosyltransferase family 4 protein [Desulfococcus sp.]|uniref:glycosyltransferase family 4 protein n=1 Tax=Desulfococcus sp. TaxID=2025834 RepID=UPI00359490C9